MDRHLPERPGGNCTGSSLRSTHDKDIRPCVRRTVYRQR